MKNITSLSAIHNHEISKALFDYLQQKLPYENKEQARELLLLGASENKDKDLLERICQGMFFQRQCYNCIILFKT